MKYACSLVFLVAGLALTGCGKDENAPTPSAPPSPPAPSTTVEPVSPTRPPAPARNGYVGAMVKAKQAAVKVSDVSALNEEIQLFFAQEGRLPADLNELVTKQYITELPDAPAGMELIYDALHGKVDTVAK
ncbi:MAG: hypothetical protein ABSC18_04635 [Verrucomicrobiota bacterium]|jgi:hypothetical protein